MRRFLLLDDEINILYALQRTLRQQLHDADVQLELFTEPQKALQRMGQVTFDFIIADYNMPYMNGVDFLRLAKEMQPDAVRLMLSASEDFSIVMDALNEAEVFRYITKPWQVADLEEIIRLALARKDQALEDRHLAEEMRATHGDLTPQEKEALRLEEHEPGITKVNWGPDGSVLLDE